MVLGKSCRRRVNNSSHVIPGENLFPSRSNTICLCMKLDVELDILKEFQSSASKGTDQTETCDFEMLLSWKEKQNQHICGCYRDKGLWVSACTVSAVYSCFVTYFSQTQPRYVEGCVSGFCVTG